MVLVLREAQEQGETQTLVLGLIPGGPPTEASEGDDFFA